MVNEAIDARHCILRLRDFVAHLSDRSTRITRSLHQNGQRSDSSTLRIRTSMGDEANKMVLPSGIFRYH
jgi:hypothetical protein